MSVDLIWIDTETTGLDPRVHAMIEVALVHTNAEASEVYGRWSQRIQLPEWAVCDPRALAVTGYAPATREWAACAHPMADVLWDLGEHLPGTFDLAGHNVAFDRRFLARSFEACGLPVPYLGRGDVDTCALAKGLRSRGAIQDRKLSTLCTFFGISNDGAHGAARDLERTIEVFLALQRWQREAAREAPAARQCELLFAG